MNGPSGRLLELLSLLQDGRGWPGAELARRLATSPRTLRRDLDRLRELGYPVVSERGPGGSYRLVAGRAMPPLLLTDEEAVATVVGLRLAALPQTDAALRKLEQVLPARLRYRVEALVASTETVSRTTPGFDLGVLQKLGTAAYAHQDVRFTYTNRSGETSARRVEPYRQLLLGRRWYLLGWDVDRADWRTFRLARIADLSVPGTTFRPRAVPDEPVTFARPGRRVTAEHAVVRFAAPVEVVSERLAAEAGSLEAIDARSCRYVTAVDLWDWLAMTLAMVGVPYVIEGPPELVARTRELAARMVKSFES